MPPKLALSMKPQNKTRVSGNFFVAEMRTVCQILDLHYIVYEPITYDIFLQQGRKEYLDLNPSEQMPTLTDGSQTIIADPPHLYKYLCKTKSIDEKFYPWEEKNKDKKKLIDQVLEWI